MPDTVLRRIGIIVMITGFLLWAYGFVYSSFWYANAKASILEPVRVWFSEVTGMRLLPGVVEEIIGLAGALLGILMQVRSYCGKRN